jgi:signal transduction histidine kinase
VILAATIGWSFVLQKKSWLLASSDVIMFLNLHFAKPLVLSSLWRPKTLSERKADYILSPLVGDEQLDNPMNSQFPEEVLEERPGIMKRSSYKPPSFNGNEANNFPIGTYGNPEGSIGRFSKFCVANNNAPEGIARTNSRGETQTTTQICNNNLIEEKNITQNVNIYLDNSRPVGARDPERDAGNENSRTDMVTNLIDPNPRVLDIAKDVPVTIGESGDRLENSVSKPIKEIARAQYDRKRLSIVSLENNFIGIKEFSLANREITTGRLNSTPAVPELSDQEIGSLKHLASIPQLKEFIAYMKNEETDNSKGSNVRRVNRSGLLDPAFRDSSNGVSQGKSVSMMNSELRSGSLGSNLFPKSGSKLSQSLCSDPNFHTDKGLAKRNFATVEKFVSQPFIKNKIGQEEFTSMQKTSNPYELGINEPKRSISMRHMGTSEDSPNSPMANSVQSNRNRHTRAK